MHLQQTKRGSRETGGPQYYFHDLKSHVKLYLRHHGAVTVALMTPYGATKSEYIAVSTTHKLDSDLAPVSGRVGHDRIQQGGATESIGEAIRKWYALPLGDFERIDVDIDIRDEAFYLTPLACKYSQRSRIVRIPRIPNPLSFTGAYASPLWLRQIDKIRAMDSGTVSHSLGEICRVVGDHLPSARVAGVLEPDLLRASGPLHQLGVTLGPYVGRGYDCLTEFRFLNYPKYSIPVEIKRRSGGFQYQQRKYGSEDLSRAVVLCAIHDHSQMPPHIDVIELRALCSFAERTGRDQHP